MTPTHENPPAFDMTSQLVEALRGLMDYVGGWDSAPTHPCGRGRDVLAQYEALRPREAFVRPSTDDLAADVAAMLVAAKTTAKAPRDMPIRRMEAAALELYTRMEQRDPQTAAASRLHAAADRLQARLPRIGSDRDYFAAAELHELRQALAEVHPR